ncbi:MAG: photosystem II stability/assembly factor-like uncharacterized protein [Mariniblastus sp.]|jgi:photosystem II stability/assembly factor-like uncharacterized protein
MTASLRLMRLGAILLMLISGMLVVGSAGGQTQAPKSEIEEPTKTVHPRLASFAEHQAMATASPHAANSWQPVGPTRMVGRGTDIAVHQSQPGTLFFGTASGGVWKSTDDGRNWKPVFENYASASIGDIAIAPSDPNMVWVGTGESNLLRSSMAGVGVYKSSDGGETFEHMGLPESHHIARIVVHPKNADIVYVAVSGHEYTNNADRGIYKTVDGGKTWERVFFKNERTSVVDLVIDPKHPGTLYAGTAPRLRRRWNDPVGGPETGVYKTTDDGRTWKSLNTNGLPDLMTGEYERVGIDVCASQPETVYVLFNHDRPATEKVGAKVYRSDDHGENFRLIAGNEKVRTTHPGYGWFFGQIRVDPNDAETLYVMGLSARISRDGGYSWESIRGSHVDYHGAWINPEDSNHVVIVNDGGVMISHDQFKTHFHPTNMQIAHLYNCGISQEAGKFWIYSSAQDTGAWRGLVDLTRGRDAIVHQPWERATGDESGRHVVDPENAGLVYSVSRYGGGPTLTDYSEKVVTERRGVKRTGFKRTDISVKWQGDRPRRRGAELRSNQESESEETSGNTLRTKESEVPAAEKKRAQWVSPLVISPHDTSRLLYGAQYVFLTDNKGKDWQKISPDLTNYDPQRQGNIAHAVVFSISESPVEKGVIYAGTDDGNLQVTRDEGTTWTNVSAGLPNGLCVASIEACRFNAGTVYAAINGKRHDDFECYLYRSRDYGTTWERITANLPGSIANVIKQDPGNENLLFAGTDRGVYVSTNGGESWEVLGKDLPTVYVHDLALQTTEDFVVIATHGRGCFVLDIRDLRTDTPRGQGTESEEVELNSVEK